MQRATSCCSRMAATGGAGGRCRPERIAMPALDKDKIYRDFARAVNMAPAELEEWLESEESRKVGWKADGRSESIGHASGRRIVGLLRTKKAALSDEDYAHMRKVVGYVARHK